MSCPEDGDKITHRFTTWFLADTQTAWTIGCAVYLYRFVLGMQRQEPSFGRNNIYLHIVCWGIPITVMVVGWLIAAYGPEYGPWCGLKDPLTDLLMVDLWIFVALLILIMLYSIVVFKLYKMVQIAERTHSENENIRKSNEEIKRVMRFIGIYPIAYCLQWTGYALFKLGFVPISWGYLMCLVITVNFGGCYNFVLYGRLLFNQLRRSKEDETIYHNSSHTVNDRLRLQQKQQVASISPQTSVLAPSSIGHITPSVSFEVSTMGQGIDIREWGKGRKFKMIVIRYRIDAGKVEFRYLRSSKVVFNFGKVIFGNFICDTILMLLTMLITYVKVPP